MSEDLSDWRRAIDPAKTAFFLDVDGTLLGFKERPEDVVADAELIALLDVLVARAGGAVAFVSGRMISDLDRIMAPLHLPAGGVHGAELRFTDGRQETSQGADLADVRAAAAAFVANHEGLRLEEKGDTTFAIHFRAAPQLETEVARVLDEAIVDRALIVQRGKMVAEVKPAGCDKGTAVEALMRTPPFTGRVPCFIGDDLTDEYGFAAVNRAAGISIKVGAPAENSVAQHRLADVYEVRGLLREICRSDEGTI